MKTRNGHVSNSSSSSFIVVGLELSREQMVEAYKIAGAELTEQDIEIIMEESPWEWPEFPGGLETVEYEYHGTWVGVSTDPTCLSVSECLNGFVSPEGYAKLQEISEKLGVGISATGGTEYC